MIDFKELSEKYRRKRLEVKPPQQLTPEQETSRAERFYFGAVFAVLLLVFGTVPVMAADDPVTTINNLSTFIFGCIRAIGVILIGFGIVQIGLSLKGHDASQRANGFMTFFGGILIAFAKTILDTILG